MILQLRAYICLSSSGAFRIIKITFASAGTDRSFNSHIPDRTCVTLLLILAILYPTMNQYWITSHQINKKVITSELQYYLGPDAHVRPYTKDVSNPLQINDS